MLPRRFLKETLFRLVLLCVNSAIVKSAYSHSCYNCDKDGCEDPPISECESAKENYSCFILSDASSNNVIRMGCLTQFVDESSIEAMIKNKTLLVCNGVNCNSFDTLSNSYECTECSSSEEHSEACATKPTLIRNKKICSNILYNQCYERVKGEATERGCLHDLEGEEFYKCLNGSDDKCNTCKSRSCNEKIIPIDRKKCHRCSSQTDANCESSPSALSVCPSYNETDNCVTVYENGVTKRDCQSELTCDYKNKNCQTCLEDGCNTSNIKKRFDNIFGIFQELPLNCNTCKGNDCKLGKPLNPNKCEGDEYQDCVTVFDANGEVIRRGCENLVYSEQQSHCDSNPELCFRCKANGCNNMTDSSTYQECLYCDTATNPDCLFNPSVIKTTRNCALGCVTSLYTRKSSAKILDLVRTCFEDIESDNYESCTVENNCIRCLNNQCNTIVLPTEGRLSCLHCTGADCDAPISKQCVGHSTDDMCYIFFDNTTMSAVRMGCRSDVPDDQLRAEIKQYFVCDGNNCNDFKNLPESLFCTACDSKFDINCAVAPSEVTAEARCGKLPYTQCYVRIREDGHTTRGCLSELSTDAFISCHDGEPSSRCKVCTSSKCNRNYYPMSRQFCYRCNSTNAVNCENAPDVIQACPLYQENDACVTQWINATTIRACASEVTCKGLSYKNCRQCSSNICNNVNLANEDIGDVGLFTELPLRCLRCSGTEECQNQTNTTEICLGNISQTCTTVFSTSGKVAARGCDDSVENACSVKGNECFKCKSNNCNIAETKKDYVDCIYCDAQNSDDCTFNVNAIIRTRKCYRSCMTALYPRTKDENPVYELIRTCLDDKDTNDRNKCASSEDPKCKSCTDSKCNKDILGLRKSCYQCKGNACQSPKAQTCRAVMDNDQCFIQYDESGSLVEMGCKSKYNFANLDILVKQKYLWLCNGDDCNHIDNSPKPQTCALCNSRTDENCATNPSKVTTTTCDKTPYTQCYSRVLEDGHTERGCLSNLEGEEFFYCLTYKNDTKCSACVGDRCNQELYPSNRSSCHVCTSTSSKECEYNPNDNKVCLLYSLNEKCITLVDISGNTMRGCSSKVSCSASNTTFCKECIGDACNNENLKRKADGKPGQWQSLPLTCLSCNNMEECSRESSKQLCTDLDYCMTVVDTTGNVVKRGCSNAIEQEMGAYCDQNSSNCVNCNSNLCNTVKSLSKLIDCIYCDSITNPNCALNPAAVEYHRKCNGGCMTALYPTANNYSYEVIRSCLDDKDLDDQLICTKGDSTECKYCSSSACNTHKLPKHRLSCYHCQGANCEEAQQLECSRYKPDDKCFALFSDVTDIVLMGCVSDLEESFVYENLRALYICSSGNNCNDFENIPSHKMCSVCNSAENPLCATNPNMVGNIARCATIPHTECFTRINYYGHTERGCLGSLGDFEFYHCLNNTYGLCQTCIGDKCNEIDVFPSSRRKCHQCNSLSDPKCAIAPDSSKVCELYKKDDECLTNYKNGVTSRGCKSAMKCDNKDPCTCRVCEDDECNTANIETGIKNGFPGRWQDVPITCYTCKGEEECTNKGVFRPCLKDPYQSCMTVFNSTTGKVFERGCSTSVARNNYLYCEKNSEKCLHCNSNGCNEASSLSQYVECSYCDTDISSNCTSNVASITSTRLCHKFCVTALYPRFNEDNPSYGLSRSCFDDMDLDDRELCVAGKKEHCKVCNSAMCNNNDIPEKHRRCYMCEGGECQDPKVLECPTYRPNDKCYTLFDEQKNVIALGCHSQFSNVEASYLLKEKRLHLCDDENCNSLSNIPDVQACILCNSRTEKNCAVNITAVSAETFCDAKPFTNCYSRVLADGATERGCLSNLDDDEFLVCLNGSSTTCESCKGNHCNKEVYPTSRLKCHVCVSDVDSYCENSPNRLAICSIYDPEDTCVTALRNNVTYRDCSSSLSCDATNPSTCHKCSGNGCNTINLAKGDDNNFGMWQDLPLSCLTCSGNDCHSKAQLLTCELNNNQDCMTVFNSSGEVISRGCSDSIQKVHCFENEENCYKCKSNGCNNATSVFDFVDCVYCKSHNNKECLWSPLSPRHKTRKCQGGCMTALYLSYNSENPAYELIRTCLDDKELADQKTCLIGKDKYCSACNGKQCNTNNVPENRLSCYTCEGETCEKPEAKICPLYRENDQCFVKFNDENSVSEMGCISSFRNQSLESLIKTKRMYVCWESNCNILDNLPNAHQCAVCNSASDVSCAVNPTSISTFVTCSMLPYKSCYTKLTKDGKTERGCLTDLPENDFAACVLGNNYNCSVCHKSSCNREIFPPNRQQCFTCTSAEEPHCDSFPTTKRACPVVSDTESCITALSSNVTVRGCKSLVYCDANDKSTCRSCFGSECNAIDLLNKCDDDYHGVWQELPLKCHTCEGEHCLHSLGPSLTCSNLNINQDCMTVFDEQGRVVRRGCSDDVEDYKDLYCRQNPERCFKCKSNECNAAWSTEEYVECLFCESKKEPLCVLEPGYGGFNARNCHKNCMVAIKANQTIRSCLDDKEAWVQHQCQQDDSKECAACSSGNCNNFAFPVDRLKCHVCFDSSCRTSMSLYCEHYDSIDFCFAKYDDGSVSLLGCASSQNASTIAEWTAQNKLYKCESDDCNELSSLPKEKFCLSCKSNETLNCAQSPLDITTTEICRAPNSRCLTRIDDHGHTIRGCLSHLNVGEEVCESLGSCTICTGEKCNSQIYPANRRKCHICSSSSDSNCRHNPSSLKICPIYNVNDSCVSALDIDRLLIRGCASEVHCSINSKGYCDVCDTDGCNTVKLNASTTVAGNNLFLTLLLAFAPAFLKKFCGKIHL